MQLLMILRIFSLGSPLAFSKFPRTGATIFSTFSTLSSTTSSSSCLSSTANPFLAQGATPLFSKLQPSFLPSAVTTSLEFLKSRFSEIESSAEKGSIDARNILPEVEKARSSLEYVWSVAGHLNGVQNSDELREKYQESQPAVVSAFSALGQSKQIFKALKTIDTSVLETAERRAVESAIRSMELAGVGLEPSKQVRFNEIKARLAELSTKFSNNVLDSTKAFELTVTDPAKLAGVPSSALGMWASSANAEKPDSVNGPFKITLDGPSYVAAMQHVPDRDIRETVYKGFNGRASSGEHDNVPLINEILSLRKEMCGILEFDNFAELSLSKKMAKSAKEVEELSDSLAAKALPMAHKELADILNLAKEIGGAEFDGELRHWDVSFFSERLKEQRFNLKDEELRPYFSLENSLKGLFGISNKLFDITIKEGEKGEVDVWNDDVQYFNVYDAKGEKIAAFFLDPYSRPSNKRGGAWMDTCISKSKALNNDIPVAYLTCNGSPPVDGKPSLMTFREVETLFHEFGHGLQHMMTKQTIGDVAGINNVEWDAVELPSQFMENWCFDRSTLFGMAKHYTTNEQLPEEIYQKLLLQRTYGSGMQTMRQLYFGQLDMALHTEYVPGQGKSVFDVQKVLAAKYSPHQLPMDNDRFLCSFSHIFGGGYSAGYYSYKWAEVMSADAFGAFEEAGLENEAEIKKLGNRFRDTVLSLGGGEEPNVVFEKFRGRAMNTEALQRHTGLI